MGVKYISDGYSPRADVRLSPDIDPTAVEWANCPVCGRRYVRRVKGQPGRPARYCSETCKEVRAARLRLARLVERVSWLPGSTRGEQLRAIVEE